MRRSLLIGALLAILLLIFVAVGHCAEIRISSDIHVQPVAEFTGSGGYPDILTLENNMLEITSIPRRGRIIHSLVLKETGNDLLYSTRTALPMDDDGISFFELGGIYCSLPWNPRDDQPYDLEYEILRDQGDEVSVKLWGEDFDTSLATEFILSLKQDSHVIEVAVMHQNPTRHTITMPIWDRFLLKPGGAAAGMELILPVDSICVVDSQNDWLGERGRAANWPAPVEKWEEAAGYARFTAELAPDSEMRLGAKNTETGEQITLGCTGDLFTMVEVLTFGPNYRRFLGAFPGYRLTRLTPEVALEPGDQIEYTILLEVDKN